MKRAGLLCATMSRGYGVCQPRTGWCSEGVRLVMNSMAGWRARLPVKPWQYFHKVTMCLWMMYQSVSSEIICTMNGLWFIYRHKCNPDARYQARCLVANRTVYICVFSCKSTTVIQKSEGIQKCILKSCILKKSTKPFEFLNEGKWPQVCAVLFGTSSDLCHVHYG